MNDILHAIQRIIAVRPQLTEQNEDFLSKLTLNSQNDYERITGIQKRVCGPHNTQWYKSAWYKLKNVPSLIYHRVTQLHSSSCVRSSRATPYPDTISRQEFCTLLLVLSLLCYTSLGGIIAFYSLFPGSSEATATNVTDAIPHTEPCHLLDMVHPMQISSIIGIAFLLSVTTLSLLSLVLKFVLLFPWSIYYSFWLVIYLFKGTPRLEQREEQQQE